MTKLTLAEKRALRTRALQEKQRDRLLGLWARGKATRAQMLRCLELEDVLAAGDRAK